MWGKFAVETRRHDAWKWCKLLTGGAPIDACGDHPR
jgi:hypothetical protein